MERRDNVYPFRAGITQQEFDRKVAKQKAMRELHVMRRRWLLWTPLLLIGAGLLVWQVVTWNPSYWLVALGIALCLPWIGDV